MSLLHPLTVILTLSLPWTAQAASSHTQDRRTALERPSGNQRGSDLGRTNAEKMEYSRKHDGKSYRPWYEQPSMESPRQSGKWYCGSIPTPGCRD